MGVVKVTRHSAPRKQPTARPWGLSRSRDTVHQGSNPQLGHGGCQGHETQCTKESTHNSAMGVVKVTRHSAPRKQPTTRPWGLSRSRDTVHQGINPQLGHGGCQGHETQCTKEATHNSAMGVVKVTRQCTKEATHNSAMGVVKVTRHSAPRKQPTARPWGLSRLRDTVHTSTTLTK